MRYISTSLAAVAFTVAGCASHSTDDRGVMQVINNTGGFIAHYEHKIEQIRLERIPVEISGACHSACVMLLAQPTVCVYPNTDVWFHGAWPKHPTNDDYNKRESWRMGRYLPSPLREMFMNVWRHVGANDFHKETGASVAAMSPQIKLCKGDPPETEPGVNEKGPER